MAIKKCKECGSEVSTKAKKCPNCGVNNPTITTKQQLISAAILIFVIIFIVSKCTSNTSNPVSYNENREKLIIEIKSYTSDEKYKIAGDFISTNNIDANFNKSFYQCMSHLVHTKSETLKLSTIMDWCKQEFVENGNRFITTYYDLDKVKDQFDPWNGSHINLTNTIKKSMHAPDSYEHLETRYRLIFNEGNPYIYLTTQFRGKNAFGAVIKQTVTAEADLKTGAITEFNQTQ